MRDISPFKWHTRVGTICTIIIALSNPVCAKDVSMDALKNPDCAAWRNDGANDQGADGCLVLDRSDWQTSATYAPDKDALDDYAHGPIEYLTYHHEGLVLNKKDQNGNTVYGADNKPIVDVQATCRQFVKEKNWHLVNG
jgi:hypothetical protein